MSKRNPAISYEFNKNVRKQYKLWGNIVFYSCLCVISRIIKNHLQSKVTEKYTHQKLKYCNLSLIISLEVEHSWKLKFSCQLLLSRWMKILIKYLISKWHDSLF
jgi:hypothetical protein